MPSSGHSSQSSDKRIRSDMVGVSLNPPPDEMSPIIKKKQKFPKSVFFIVGNEFCERFSYYGMRTVLTLYFTDQLGMSDNNATVIYHVFVMLCYFSPILGAMLADSWLGKFRTIFYVSLIYALGNIVLSIASVPPLNIPMLPLSMVGLFLISLGTGGIKPCVSAFGGDQFDADNISARERFFFVFYFSINAGSLISTFLTPILRADVHCFGGDTCFPLAFGLPAALMIISIILFVAGKTMYRMIPPKGNVVVKVCKCVGHALANKWSAKEKKEHWLDYASDTYDKRFIGDVRSALRVMYLYLPLPVFWALYDQQGSRWTLQATEMDGKLGPSYNIQPDQMQVVNPLLILMFIPFFETLVYPFLARWNILTKPLRRIFYGGLLAAVAFIVAGGLQYAIEGGLPAQPDSHMTDISFINMSPCNLTLLGDNGYRLNTTIAPMNVYSQHGYDLEGSSANYSFTVDPGNCSAVKGGVLNLPLSDRTAYVVSITSFEGVLNIAMSPQKLEKPSDGNANLRFAYELSYLVTDLTNTSTIVVGDANSDNKGAKLVLPISDEYYGFTDYVSLLPNTYDIQVSLANGTLQKIGQVKVLNGGGYTCAIQNAFTETASGDNMSSTARIQEVGKNTINMLWQVPQYVIITCAEIMFSITGLEFSYSQAPVTMKSVLQAAWLLTDAFGNVIIIIIAEIEFFDRQSYEYFLFAGIMIIVMFIFALMAMNYEYVTPRALDPDELDGGVLQAGDGQLSLEEKPKKNKDKGHSNDGFSDDDNPTDHKL